MHKLVKAGHRVAICDQLEDPKQAKGIVKRGVTELLSPGTATSDKLLEHNSNNFLAAIHEENEQYGLAFTDISTGEFFVAEGNREYADKLLQSLKPAEVVFQRNKQKRLPTDFWSLDLPAETTAYVPKLLALVDILKRPDDFDIVWKRKPRNVNLPSSDAPKRFYRLL